MPRTVLALALAVAVFALHAKLCAEEALAEKLDRQIDFDRAIEAPLRDFFEFLTEKLGAKITLDKESFAKERRKGNLEEVRIRIPKIGEVCFHTIIRLMLSPINAVYEVHDNQIVILPDTKDGQTRDFPPLTEKQKERAKQLHKKTTTTSAEIRRSIEAPLKDILELVTDRYDVTIVFDVAAYRKAKVAVPDDSDTRLRLEAQNTKLDKLLDQLCQPLQAKWEIEDNVILIRPAPKK
jgi:hypothetical protein